MIFSRYSQMLNKNVENLVHIGSKRQELFNCNYTPNYVIIWHGAIHRIKSWIWKVDWILKCMVYQTLRSIWKCYFVLKQLLQIHSNVSFSVAGLFHYSWFSDFLNSHNLNDSFWSCSHDYYTLLFFMDF